MTKKITDRYAALLILAALLFNPPIISIFNSPQLVLGVPLLFLYLFVAWSLIIGLNAYLASRLSEGEKSTEEQEDNNNSNSWS